MGLQELNMKEILTRLGDFQALIFHTATNTLVSLPQIFQVQISTMRELSIKLKKKKYRDCCKTWQYTLFGLRDSWFWFVATEKKVLQLRVAFRSSDALGKRARSMQLAFTVLTWSMSPGWWFTIEEREASFCANITPLWLCVNDLRDRSGKYPIIYTYNLPMDLG